MLCDYRCTRYTQKTLGYKYKHQCKPLNPQSSLLFTVAGDESAWSLISVSFVAMRSMSFVHLSKLSRSFWRCSTSSKSSSAELTSSLASVIIIRSIFARAIDRLWYVPMYDGKCDFHSRRRSSAPSGSIAGICGGGFASRRLRSGSGLRSSSFSSDEDEDQVIAPRRDLADPLRSKEPASARERVELVEATDATRSCGIALRGGRAGDWEGSSFGFGFIFGTGGGEDSRLVFPLRAGDGDASRFTILVRTWIGDASRFVIFCFGIGGRGEGSRLTGFFGGARSRGLSRSAPLAVPRSRSLSLSSNFRFFVDAVTEPRSE